MECAAGRVEIASAMRPRSASSPSQHEEIAGLIEVDDGDGEVTDA